MAGVLEVFTSTKTLIHSLDHKLDNVDTLGRVKCAVLGARGLVAQRLIQRLTDHHWFAPVMVVGSLESEGMMVSEIPWSFTEPRPALPDMCVTGIGEDGELAKQLISEGVRIVFSALPDSPASLIERDLAKSGLVVISHSTIHRHSHITPLVVPEVNNDHLRLLESQTEYGEGMLVSCSNCMVVPLAITLAPVIRDLPVVSITITTEQSLSGGGRKTLENSRIGIFPDSSIPGESKSVESELRRILGKYDGSTVKPLGLPIEANCKRVKREFGHSASVTLDFSRDISAHEITTSWSEFLSPVQHLDLPSGLKSPIIFVSNIDNISERSDNPENNSLLNSMEIYIGSIRVYGNSASFDVISDNTVRGAAGNSILLAEMMLAQGIIHDSSSVQLSSHYIQQK